MPKPMASTSGDDLKSSAQVWGGQAEMSIDDSPPAYSGTIPSPTSSSSRPDLPSRPRRRTTTQRESYNPITALSRWSRIPWGRYVVPDAVVSADRTTITTTNTAYLSNQQSLIKLLGDQSDLPPMPILKITGEHMHNVAAIPKIDFNITISLSGLIDLTRPPRWHNKPAQVVPLPNSSGRAPASSSVIGTNTVQIEQFARQFLRDKSDRKSFVLSRTIENLPTDVIEGLVRNLIASLHYRGKVNVMFPVQCGQLIVQKKPVGTGAAVGGWFMNVLGLSPDVKYETLERVWAVGSPKVAGTSEDNEEEEVEAEGDGGANGLVKEWWNSWAPVIRDSVLLSRQGKVGIEDWMETQMGWRPKAKLVDWGMDYA